MPTLSISDLDLNQKKALVRVDFNVPLKEDGSIADSLRISETLPTLKFLLEKGASIILMSHLGRPKGYDKKYSLSLCAKALSSMMQKEVLFASDCIGDDTKEKVKNLKPGEIILLENLRFYPAEKKPDLDPSFAETLASYGDVYINDAFAACHRNHSSITEVASKFPKTAAAGFLLEKEIKALSIFCKNPPRPFHAIIGGSKISSKLGVIESLIQKADSIYIGGAMAFTFFKALGYEIGNSLFESDLVSKASEIMEICHQKKIALFLPTDISESSSFSIDGHQKIVKISEGISPNWYGMDIGPETLASWEKSLENAASIFWNGPLGVFELAPFSKGTFSLAKFLSKLSSYRVIGGGDSAAAIEQAGLANDFSHISTGGGASLEFIELGSLPGIEALTH